MQRAEKLRQRLVACELVELGEIPHGFRLERCQRQIEWEDVYCLLCGDASALESHDLLGDLDGAEAQLESEPPFASPLLEDLRFGFLLRDRVPVTRERLDERRACSEVERAHVIRLAEVQVHGALVHGGVRPLEFGDSEQRAARFLDDGDRLWARRA